MSVCSALRVRQEMLAHSTNNLEFFTESLDASRFPSPQHYTDFGNYIKDKYSGQRIDLVMMFMARNFMLAHEMATALPTNIRGNSGNPINSPQARPPRCAILSMCVSDDMSIDV